MLDFLGVSINDLNNVPEQHLLPNGEHRLTIEKAEVRTTQDKEKQYIQVILMPADDPNAAPIFHSIFGVDPNDDERQKNNTLRRMKDFFAAFGLTPEIPVEQWNGSTAWAVVTTKSDPTYGDRNNITRFVPAK